MAGLGTASYRDRTAELFSTAERLKKVQGVGSGPSTSGSTYEPHANGHARTPSWGQGPQQASVMQSEFSRRASSIGLSIHQTSQKLAKLAKCKSLLRGF